MNKERIEDKVQDTEGSGDNNRPAKGKRSNNSRKRRSSKGNANAKFRDAKVTNKCNDVKWYAANSELLRSAATLPFSTTSGLPVDIYSQTKEGVPGILTLHWVPCLFGANYAHAETSYTPSDGLKALWANAPVNQAAFSMYSYTVHANSRSKSYDAADEMLLVLAGAQIFSMLAFGIRAYGIMRKYDQQNAYTPAHLVRAMGFDYEDLQSNLANMWFTLNDLIDRVQQIWIPNTFPFIERWFWMNSNIYKDANGVKSQYYMFVPGVFYQYNETLNDMGGGLEPVRWDASTAHTWNDYVNIVTNAIQKLLLSQDRGIIFGDILKAYGAENLYKIGTISSDYMVEPVYDQEVLMQIENSTSYPIYPNAISQWDNGTISQEFAKNNPGNFITRAVLNFHTDSVPTPEMIMVATRLTSLGFSGTTTSDKTAYTSIAPGTVGTEYITECAMWTLVNGSLVKDWLVSAGSFGGETATAEDLTRMARWSSFDWAPWVYTTKGTIAPGNEMEIVRAFGDYDQYTTIDRATLQKMHRTAVYSEFGMPTEI